MLALQTEAVSPEERARIIGLVERAIEQAGFGLALSVPIVVLENAVREHLAVLLGAIFALAAMMSLVAALGLTAAMGMSVTERTRELAVMRAVGATPPAILKVLLTEGLVVGLLSAAVAVALAVPLSAAVGGLIGSLAFRAALPLVMSPSAVAISFAAALLLAGVATLVPALRAMRMSLHRALSFS
jgi:putative ABC transport system permease protein